MPTIDRQAVMAALREAGGNVGKAAKLLNASRRTLQNRMREYGIPEGRTGRPKRHLLYSKKRKLWLAGGAVAAVGAAILIGRRASSD